MKWLKTFELKSEETNSTLKKDLKNPTDEKRFSAGS